MMTISAVLFLIYTAGYVASVALCPLAQVHFLLGLPIFVWLSNLLHESAHLAAYLCLRLQFKRMRFSWFLLRKQDGTLRFSFEAKAKIYEAECVCAYDRNAPYWKYCIALLAGGVACAVVCTIAICLSLTMTGVFSPLFLCLGVAMGLNAAINLLYPKSTDRRVLRKIREEKNLDDKV